MERKRPEPPPEWFADPEADDKRRRKTEKAEKRRRVAEQSDQIADEEPGATEPEQPARPEQSRDADTERRERATEEFHRRVELAELLRRIPDDVRQRVEAALDTTSREWWLERGRYVFSRLTTRETIQTPERSIVFEHRFALRREEAPHEPQGVGERISEVLEQAGDDADAEAVATRLAELSPLLAPRDEVVVELPEAGGERPARIRLSADGADVIRPRSEAAETVGMSAEQPPAPDQADGGTVAELAAVLETPPRPEPADPLPLSIAEISDVAETVWREVDDDEPPETVMPGTQPVQAPEAVPADVVSRVVEPGMSAEIPAEPEPPAAERATSPRIAAAIAELETYAVELNDLPPMRGGAPDRARRRTDEAEEPARSRPAPPRHGVLSAESPSSRYAERQVYVWEEHWRQPERRPDFRMTRKARKLVRILARRYGLTLTPELEAYLLEIVLRPKIVGGRKVYGLGLNREELLRVLSTLWLNFGDLYARRP